MAKNWLTALVTGDQRRLAELAIAEGKIDAAVEALTKGGFYMDAARLAEEHGKRAKAVELYIKAVLGKDAGDVADGGAKQAGELLVASGQYKDAVALFEAAQAWKQAADIALKINQPARAAKFYEKAGLWAPAATNFERVSLPADALRMHEKESLRLAAEKVKDANLLERIRITDLKRAELMAKVGRNAEAAALYKTHGQIAKAAGLLSSAGQPKEAAEAYLAAGLPEQALKILEKSPTMEPRLAAEIYKRNGRHREAAQFLATLGRSREAAEAYESAGDFAKAAELWERAHEQIRAATAYKRANKLRDAGRCFDAAGSPLVAAEAYASAGDHLAAADAYVKGGAPYQAASCFLRVGRKQDASRALQQVTPADPAFERATLDLVPLLMEEGFLEPALHRLRMMPNEPKGGPTVLADRWYWEGRVLEAQHRGGEAEVCYQKILALNREHRDVAKRLADLHRAGLATGAVTAGTVVTGPRPGAGSGEPPAPTGAGNLAQTEAQVPRAHLRPTGPRLNELPNGHLLVDRYEILGELGQGGMGKVYKAHDRELDDVVAIKTMLRSTDPGGSDEERLLREVQICRKITHPNVVRVFDLGRQPDGIFVTLEYIDGPTLEALIKRRSGPSLSLGKIKWILSETASGLREAHSLQVVHRDLKPSNLILTENRLKILDFGIARMAGSDTRLTRTGFAVGTPLYMSPEQVRGSELDGRSDLYSLGIIAYRLLAGREPFIAEAATSIALMHLQQPPPDLEAFRPGLPTPWKDFVSRILAKDVAARFQSADEVLRAIPELPQEATTQPVDVS
jgi:serine/threonine-protein kinase